MEPQCSDWVVYADDEMLTVRLEFFMGAVFLHAVIKGRRIEAVRRFRSGFADLKAYLRVLGYKAIHVIIPEGDAMLYRFERLFGFVECAREGGNILMRQEV